MIGDHVIGDPWLTKLPITDYRLPITDATPSSAYGEVPTEEKRDLGSPLAQIGGEQRALKAEIRSRSIQLHESTERNGGVDPEAGPDAAVHREGARLEAPSLYVQQDDATERSEAVAWIL